jgi:hypothetical protein
MLIARAVAALVIATLVSAPVLADPWMVTQGSDGKNRAEVRNDSGSLRLLIFCGGDGAMVTIVHQNAVPWLGNQPADLTIDGETFLLSLSKENETSGTFNLKPQSLKPAMVGALRSGEQLVLGGSALTDVDEADRVFTLAGSSRALDEVPGGCT